MVLGYDIKSAEAVSSFDLSYGAYLIGTMGSGKSTIMQRMILDDLDEGRGFILLDPHRQLVETILSTVPRSHAGDLTVIDMTDNPPGFGINLFDCADPTDELAFSQTAELFVDTFRQALSDTSTSWGSLLDSLLYSIAYLVAANPGTGLPDIPKILRDDRYRATLLTRVTNEIVLDYWEGEYAEMSERSRAREIGSTMRRLRSFITNPILNQIFRIPKTTIDFKWLMDEGPGLLVALDPNQPHASNLIGALMLAKIKQHTFERTEQAENRPFRVYADEFQKFTTTDFDRFWGESRKFNVGVIAAHQFRNQLTPELRSASASVGTRLVFAVNHEDASDLGRMFTLSKTLGEPEFKRVIEDIIEPEKWEWYWDPADTPEQIKQLEAKKSRLYRQLEDIRQQGYIVSQLFRAHYRNYPDAYSKEPRNWSALTETDVIDLSWLINPVHHHYLDKELIKTYIMQHGERQRVNRKQTIMILPRRDRLVTVPLNFAGKATYTVLDRTVKMLMARALLKRDAIAVTQFTQEILGERLYAELLARCLREWMSSSPFYEFVLRDERDLAVVDGWLRVRDEHGEFGKAPYLSLDRPDLEWFKFFVFEAQPIDFKLRQFPQTVAWLAERVVPVLLEPARKRMPVGREIDECNAQIKQLLDNHKQRLVSPERIVGQRYKKVYEAGYTRTFYDWQRSERTMMAGEFARHLSSQPPFQAYVKTNLGQWEIRTTPPPSRTGIDPTAMTRRSRALFAPASQPAREEVRKPEGATFNRAELETVFKQRPQPSIIKRRPDS